MLIRLDKVSITCRSASLEFGMVVDEDGERLVEESPVFGEATAASVDTKLDALYNAVRKSSPVTLSA